MPAWDFDALAACGALHSTVADLLRFLQANLAAPAGPLGPALRMMRDPRRDADLGRVGLGWHVSDAEVVWHNGGTFGSHSFVGFEPERGLGVVVLANGASFAVDHAGTALLELLAGGQASLDLPPTVALDPETLERYVGTYDLGDGTVLDVARDGARLWARVTGQDAYRLFAVGEDEFAWRIVPASLTFRSGADGNVEAAVLHQDGADVEAHRLAP